MNQKMVFNFDDLTVTSSPMSRCGLAKNDGISHQAVLALQLAGGISLYFCVHPGSLSAASPYLTGITAV